MGYNYSDLSDESDTNVRFGWAAQVLQIMNQINTYNYLCAIHDSTALRPLYSHILVLRDMLSAKFPKELEKVDKVIKESEDSLMTFERRRFMPIQEGARRKYVREVHNKLRKAYEDIMFQMRVHGILETIRMDVKTMARQSWYGDSRPVN